MYVIEQEIMTQHVALKETMRHMREMRETLDEMFACGFEKIVFIGCGSSYMLARSAAMLFSMRTDMKSLALAGGDYIIDPESYAPLMKNALVVVITRSGQTSEIDYAVDSIKASGNNCILCLHAHSGSAIPAKCEWEIALDWAFDHSVCQTRTISNFYAALVWLYAVYANDASLMADLDDAANENEAYKIAQREGLERIGRGEWENVIVLADAELCGIAQEGALAFNEICIKRGEYFNFLDYRHGPMVLLGARTLVIAVVREKALSHQVAMIKDLKARGATVVTVSTLAQVEGGDHHVQIGSGDYAAWGVPFIYVPQMISYSRAIKDGHNPDEPDGLDPFITI